MQFGNFPNANLVCAFSNRRAGNMSLFYGDTKESLNNRKNFLQGLGIDYRDLICAKQVHGNTSRYVQESDKAKGALLYDTAIADTDALITDKRNLSLAVFTADCLSIFLYDHKTEGIGLVHAGWRSTKEKIVEKTLKLMQERFAATTEELYIGFGPAIRSCCYIVKEELADFFSEGIIKKDNHYYLDLLKINKKQLLDLGVKDNHIFDSQICTVCCNEDFFSYRKEGNNCGRMISAMMRR